jgi:hypothetical protein
MRIGETRHLPVDPEGGALTQLAVFSRKAVA